MWSVGNLWRASRFLVFTMRSIQSQAKAFQMLGIQQSSFWAVLASSVASDDSFCRIFRRLSNEQQIQFSKPLRSEKFGQFICFLGFFKCSFG